MLSFFAVKAFSVSWDITITDEPYFHSFNVNDGHTLSIVGTEKNMLVIFRTTVPIVIEAYSKESFESEKTKRVDVKDITYIYFKNTYGQIQIEFCATGIFQVSAVCLPKNCTNYFWGTNANHSVFSLTDHPTNKMEKTLAKGKTYCAMFSNSDRAHYVLSTNVDPEKTKISFVRANSSIYGSGTVVEDLNGRSELDWMYVGFFTIEVKGKDKNRFLQIQDNTEVIRPNNQFSTWIIEKTDVSPWTIFFSIIFSLLFVCLISFGIYQIYKRKHEREIGPEYKNLTRLPVELIPDKD